jgi:hypothetical protein
LLESSGLAGVPYTRRQWRWSLRALTATVPGLGCVKTRTLFFKVEFWPRLGGNSSQEIFRHHREGTTKEKDSQLVSRRSVFTQPGSFAAHVQLTPMRYSELAAIG